MKETVLDDPDMNREFVKEDCFNRGLWSLQTFLKVYLQPVHTAQSSEGVWS